MRFEYNAFTADDILQAVNRSLAEHHCTTRATILLDLQGSLNNLAVLRTARGGTLIAVLWSPSKSVMGIRGIHRVKRPNKAWSVLINGQAGKNVETLVFTGENGTLTPCDYDQYAAFLRQLVPNQTDAFYHERIRWELDANLCIKRALHA